MLPPGQHETAPALWPVVGERSASVSKAPWTLTISGLVEQEKQWSVDELRALPGLRTRVDVHCVTRWSKTGMDMACVALGTALEACSPTPEAAFLSFIARTDRKHHTSLPLDDALRLGAFLAMDHQGKPLAPEQGGPLRLIVPNRYFYKSLKWLERIDVLAEDRRGYWETVANHHNSADPRREQRYEEGALDSPDVDRRLAKRDISGRDFSGLLADDLDLTGLDGRGAALRGASLRRTNLTGANLDGANLTNCSLKGAVLQRATLRPLGDQPADAEGVDFRGADLRGAVFVGVSLLGATFCSEPGDPGSGTRRNSGCDHKTRCGRLGLAVLLAAPGEIRASGDCSLKLVVGEWLESLPRTAT